MRGATIARLVAAGGAGYLAGTLPSADLAARAAGGGDLRRRGSGNPGAANAATVLGARWGAAVLVADIAKGAGATLVGRGLAGAVGADLAGTAAVAGHCYPLGSGRRGGKGVATSVGQVLGTFPAYFPVDCAVAAATVAIPGWKGRAFAANTVASLCWVAGSAWRWRTGRAPASLPVAAAVSSGLIFSRFARSERSR